MNLFGFVLLLNDCFDDISATMELVCSMHYTEDCLLELQQSKISYSLFYFNFTTEICGCVFRN